MFLCYAAGIRWGFSLTCRLRARFTRSGVLTAVKGELLDAGIRLARHHRGHLRRRSGLAFLGDINRRFAAQIDFFSRISSTMQVDQGLAESLLFFSMNSPSVGRRGRGSVALPATRTRTHFSLAANIRRERAACPGEHASFPTDGFLLDDLDATICWNSLVGQGSGFGWDRRGRRRSSRSPGCPAQPSKSSRCAHL